MKFHDDQSVSKLFGLNFGIDRQTIFSTVLVKKTAILGLSCVMKLKLQTILVTSNG